MKKHFTCWRSNFSTSLLLGKEISNWDSLLEKEESTYFCFHYFKTHLNLVLHLTLGLQVFTTLLMKQISIHFEFRLPRHCLLNEDQSLQFWGHLIHKDTWLLTLPIYRVKFYHRFQLQKQTWRMIHHWWKGRMLRINKKKLMLIAL